VNGTERMSDKVILVLLTALLAFIGAVGGNLVTSRLERTQWERQTGYKYQQGVFETRLELIERTAELTNKADIARIYDVGTQNALLDAKASIGEPDKVDQATEEVADYSVKREELDADLAAVLSLDRVYFGPKTNEAITRLTDDKDSPWWEADASEFLDLLAAMRDNFGTS
jgi:hypothetical protein